MIIYGLTMQDKEDVAPKEVAEWLLERNAHYPNIDFKIDHSEPPVDQKATYDRIARKYVRFYASGKEAFGVLEVIFPYPSQLWSIRIIGGLDKDGNAAIDAVEPLGPKMRAEIAGIASGTGLLETLVQDKDGIIGWPRGEEAYADPSELVPLTPDDRWTSELTLSGAEFIDILNDPTLGAEAEQALWAKDWETLRRLKKQRG